MRNPFRGHTPVCSSSLCARSTQQEMQMESANVANKSDANAAPMATMKDAVTLIKVVSAPYDDSGGAQDALAGISSLGGYVFGFVDEKEKRTVSFHEDSSPESELPTRHGMTRVLTRSPMGH
ncbi:hypothetical protein BYI23_E001380 (plasmid) [Burkholderia sp. YI23]|nr:hypothetical protein BYI23_E001380 [Burkholderia sp. YI23]